MSGKAGRIAHKFLSVELVILDELGKLLFTHSLTHSGGREGGASPLYPINKLHQQSSVLNLPVLRLSFHETSGVHDAVPIRLFYQWAGELPGRIEGQR